MSTPEENLYAVAAAMHQALKDISDARQAANGYRAQEVMFADLADKEEIGLKEKLVALKDYATTLSTAIDALPAVKA